MKDDEEVILYLLWYDHRPLRIVNVGDCECHRLWDIGRLGGLCFGRDPQVNGKEKVLREDDSGGAGGAGGEE